MIRRFLSGVLAVTLMLTSVPVNAAEANSHNHKVSVNVGDTYDLDGTETPSNGYWTSWNINKVKVNQDGVVTGVRPGKVTVTQRTGLNFDKYTVTVMGPTIKVNKKAATLYAGEGTSVNTLQLKATTKGSSKNITWESSDEKIATVDSNGKVTTVAPGKVKIYAKANGETAQCDITVKGTSIKLNLDEMNLSTKGAGSSIKLVPTVVGSKKAVKWSTSDKKVAVVKGGTVTGKNTGEATITATANGVSATCKVIVKKGNVSISEESVLLYTAESKKLKSNTGKKDVVTWYSSDDKVATVDNKGKVTAVGAGTASISVSANDTGDSCQIVVKDSKIRIGEDRVELKTKGTDKTRQLGLEVTGRNTKAKWVSSDKKVVAVNGKGKLTAKKAGTATITASANGVSDTVEVVVKDYSPTIKLNQEEYDLYTGKGNSTTLKAKIDGPVKKAVWSSSDESVATVNNKGKVVANKPGQTVITVSANGVSDDCIITVSQSKLILGNKTIYLEKGKTAELPVDVVGASQSVSYKTSNGKVASVKKGVITAKGYGETDITVKANGITEVCHVYVDECMHEFGEFSITKEATCQEEGLKVATCKNCQGTKVEKIDKTEHTWVETETKPVTCVTDGTVLSKCSVCNETTQSIIKHPGHDYGDWILITTPSNFTEGVEKQYCKVCNHENVNILPPVTHEPWEHVFMETVVEPTCTEKGYTRHSCDCAYFYDDNEVEALGHAYVNGVCERCKATEIEGTPLTPDILDYIVGKDPQGEIEIPEDLKDEAGQPLVITEIPDYAFKDMSYITSVIIPDTVVKIGKEIFIGCDAMQKVVLPDGVADISDTAFAGCVSLTLYYNCGVKATGEPWGAANVVKEHSWGEWVITKEPTETEVGIKEKTCSSCNEKLTEEIAVTDHVCSYVPTVTPPTCTEEGYTTYTCKCGDTYVDTKIPAHGHKFGEWVVTKEPTETEVGEKEHVCTVCGAKETQETPVLSHTHKYTDDVVDPTCTEVGYTVHTCACGDVYTDTEVPAIGHDLGEWSEVAGPTCKQEGSKEAQCTRCEYKETASIPMLEHTYEEVVTDPTCTEKGFTTYTCTGCGDSYTGNEVKELGHDYEDVVTPPTCTEEGYTTHTCKVCKDSYVDNKTDKSNHSFGSWVTVKEATEFEEGLRERKCENCPEVQTQPIPKADHVHDYITEVTAPTCTEEGYTTYTCSKCNASYTDDPVSATGHSYTEATYGWSEGYLTCTATKVCQNDLSHVVTETVNATPNTVSEPNCTEAGEKTYTVNFEKEGFTTQVKSEELPALNHDVAEEHTVDLAPTCTEDGSKSKHCSRCDYKEDVTPIEALGHDWSEIDYSWAEDLLLCTATRTCNTDTSHVETETVTASPSVTQDPTCTVPGVKTFTAVFSNEVFGTKTQTQEIPANGHTEVVDEAVAPTCEETGLTEGSHCSVCTETIVAQEVVKATGHLFDDAFYTWTEDYNTCTAKRICEYDNNHVEVETVESSVSTNDPTCIAEGATIYTANFENEAFETQATSTPIPMLEHVYVDEVCTGCGKEQYKKVEADGDDFTVDGDGKLDIPGYVEGDDDEEPYKITSIAPEAFKDNDDIEEVVIPVPVEEIGDGAFEDCDKLEDVSLPDSLKVIGVGAFKGCDYVTCIVIPDSVEVIGENAFVDCPNLRYICYNGPAEGAPWGATNADVGPHRFLVAYDWEDDFSKCTATKTCEKCGQAGAETEVTKPLSSVTEPATCTALGVRTYTAVFNNPAYTNQTKAEDIPMLEHPYNDYYTVDLEPTCTEAGSESRHCAACTAKTDEREIPKNGHQFSDVGIDWAQDCSICTAARHCYICSEQESETVYARFELIDAPSCTVEGSKEAIAEFENEAFETQTKIVAVNKLDHTPETDEAVAPTCTETGLTEGSHCSVCKAVLVAQDILQPNGHSPVNGGLEDVHSKCSVCGNTLEDGTEHTFVRSVKTPASCEFGAEVAYSCECGYAYCTFDEIGPLGHEYNTEYVWSDNFSNCTADAICTRYNFCGSKVHEKVTPSIRQREATCTTEGSITYTATFNSELLDQQVETVVVPIDSTRHTQSVVPVCEENTCTKYLCCGAVARSTHDYTADSNVKYADATCTKPQLNYKSCAVCEYNPKSTTLTMEVGRVDANNHTGDIINAATSSVCTKYSCCNKTVSTSHKYTVDSGIKCSDATCEEPQHNYAKCSVCNYNPMSSTVVVDYGLPLGHKCPPSSTGRCTISVSSVVSGSTVCRQGHTANEYTFTCVHSSCGEDTTTCVLFYCPSCEWTLISSGELPSSGTVRDYVGVSSRNVECSNAVSSTSAATYEWSGYDSCEATFTCSTCKQSVTERGTITNEVTIEPTCENGIRTYTATFNTSGLDTQTKDEDIPGVKQHKLNPESQNGICSICNSYKAGAYDSNGIMLASWDDLCNYNGYSLDVEEDFTSTQESDCYEILTNQISDASILVVDSSVKRIGNFVFSDCTKLRKVIIPFDVTSIGDYAFSGCSSLEAIKIPSGVTSIGSSAFRGCTNLISVNIPNSVKSIGNNTFFDCNSLTSISIPNSVESIGDLAFYGCISLTSVTIPNSVVEIGSGAFRCCSRLKRVKLPNNISRIRSATFYGCTGLMEISIPDSVTIIEDLAFNSCTKLACVDVPHSVICIMEGAFNGVGLVNYYHCNSNIQASWETWGAFDVELIIDTDTYVCPVCDSYIAGAYDSDGNIIMSWDYIKANYSIAPATAYTSSTYKTNISSPYYILTNYDELANTKTLVVGEEITTIGAYAFYQCTGLTKIVLPETMTKVNGYGFSDCTALEQVTIPVSATYANANAFKNCKAIDKVVLTSGTGAGTVYKNDSTNSVYTYRYTPWYISRANITEIVVKEGVVSLGAYTFKDCTNLQKVSLPESLTSIAGYTFNLCSNLSEINIPAGLTTLGTAVFSGNTSLTSITVPEGITALSTNVFKNCTSLAELTMPASTTIAETSFSGCTGIKKVTLTAGTGVMPSYTTTTFKYTPWYISREGIEEIYMEDGVTSITAHAFRGCTGLKKLTISDSALEMGDYAMYNCTGLVDYTAPCNLEYKLNTAVGCDYVEKLTLTKGTGVMPDFSTVVKEYADYSVRMYECRPWCYNKDTSVGMSTKLNLRTAVLENGITSIDKYAFEYCAGLTSVTVPNSVTSIDKYAFKDCSGLTSITIPDSVTSIGYGAFKNCTSLTSITIPDSVTSIDFATFSNCSSLTSITVDSSNTVYDSRNNCNAIIRKSDNTLMQGCNTTVIPSNVTRIDSYAFHYCKGLTSITIPDSVTSIGYEAFYHCTGLTSITIPDSVTSIGDDALCRVKQVYYNGTATGKPWGAVNVSKY